MIGFARLPDKKLPADFQTLLMERIRQEALLRAERRKGTLEPVLGWVS